MAVRPIFPCQKIYVSASNGKTNCYYAVQDARCQGISDERVVALYAKGGAMIFLHVEETDSRYGVKVNECDVSTHEAPPDFGSNIKCIYSHDRYEILGEVVAGIETRNGGSLHSDDFEHLAALLDEAYVETLFKYRKREVTRKAGGQRKGWSFFSRLS